MDVELLERVLYTLNNISVKGKDNLDMLLGCINTINSIIQVAKIKDAEKTEEA